jgi:hypothetical protein
MMYYLLDWYYHGEGDGATEEEDDGNPGKDENGDVGVASTLERYDTYLHTAQLMIDSFQIISKQ